MPVVDRVRPLVGVGRKGLCWTSGRWSVGDNRAGVTRGLATIPSPLAVSLVGGEIGNLWGVTIHGGIAHSKGETCKGLHGVAGIIHNAFARS